MQFEKTEYDYYAAALIFGKQSPKMRNYSAYSFEALHKHKTLNFSEYSDVDEQGHLQVKRRLPLDQKRTVVTSHTDMRSGINRIVAYTDSEHDISMSDAIFNDYEIKKLEGDWERITGRKIRNLSFLIEALFEREVTEVPLLIEDFPEITKTLFAYPNYWLRKGPDDREYSNRSS